MVDFIISKNELNINTLTQSNFEVHNVGEYNLYLIFKDQLDDFHFKFEAISVYIIGNPVVGLDFKKLISESIKDGLSIDKECITSIFEQLCGICGIILIDYASSRIKLLMDPLGFAPFYHYKDLHFITSDINFIVKVFGNQLNWDLSSVHHYILNGHMKAENSWWVEVKRLWPATVYYYCKEEFYFKTDLYWSWKSVTFSDNIQKSNYRHCLSILRKRIGLLNQNFENVFLAISGGRDSRLLASIGSLLFPFKTFVFGIHQCWDRKIAIKSAAKLQLEIKEYELMYNNWFNDRWAMFIKAGGLVSLNYFHEGNILDELGKKIEVLISGFFGGFYGVRFFKSFHEKGFKIKDEDWKESFYNNKSLHSYMINYKMKNSSAIHVYHLSRYFKVATPFYSTSWIKAYYAGIGNCFSDQYKYNSIVSLEVSKDVLNISWQKTGIPLKWKILNSVLICLHWDYFLNKITRLLNIKREFYNYNKIETQVNHMVVQIQVESYQYFKPARELNFHEKINYLSYLTYFRYCKQISPF